MKIHNLTFTAHLVSEGPAVTITSPELAVSYMAGAFDDYPEQEQFWVVPLNRKNFAKGRHRITIGTLTSTLASPREVFRVAIATSSAAVMLFHNHPSGDPSPSSADIGITRQLREAAKIIDIAIIDHLIIGDAKDDPAGKGYFSFKEAGLL